MASNSLREAAFHVLASLAGRPQHGYTLIEDIARMSEGRVRVRTGTIYSILDRLRASGLIEVDREEIVSSRLRRYYRLTDSGTTALGSESEALRRRANAADSSLRVPRPVPAGDDAAGAGHPAATWLRRLPRSERFAHPALLYRDPDGFLEGVVPFIVAGLDTGEAVAVAVPTANLALVRQVLGSRASHVYMIDMAVAGRNPGRILPTMLLTFAQTHAGRRVRIVDEPMWPSRSPAEYFACVQHEALINLAFADREATILCPYDATRLDPRVLHDAARTHPVLIDESGRRASDAYAPHEVVDDYNVPLRGGQAECQEAFDFNATSLPHVRAHAAAMATRLGLPANRGAEVDRVVGELATNSVRHAGGHGRLRIWTADGHVVCQVEDTGRLADPLAGRRPVPEHEPVGRGLLIVNRIADLVQTHVAEGGTTVRAYFGIGPQ